MLFNSFEFLVFFPAVTAFYFVLPHGLRWMLLLAASCYFYMAFIPAYILILAGVITIDYCAGILIEKTAGPGKRIFLVLSLIANIGLLVAFKYLSFLSDNGASIHRWLFHSNLHIPHLSLILPLGLSFHTFQGMSYTLEVYRGNQRAERHPGIYALYVMFYPQLVAGPIERPQNLLHQFREPHDFDGARVIDGLKLMAWGLFKKVVIADRLALLVNHVYASPSSHEGPTLILATVCFAFQIYCDFSGYSDIAIGAAQVMGFNLMENFNRPYSARSVREFWKKWHISLSTWFRDYLYIPLGGNRGSRLRWAFVLSFTFLGSGLWHGASWMFVIWGGLNAFYMLVSYWTEGFRGKVVSAAGLDRFPALHHALKVSITFSLICFSWIFFRSNELQDALYISSHLFSGFERLFDGHSLALFFSEAETGFNTRQFFIAGASLAVLEIVHHMERHGRMRRLFSGRPVFSRWALYSVMTFFIAFFGVFKHSPFIYFQF